MKCKKIFKCEIIGIFVVVALGFLWHELFDLSGKNIIIGMIAPVNESIWEHWKLCVFPMLIYAAVEYPFVKDEWNNFLFSKFIGIVVAIIVCFGLIALWKLAFPDTSFKSNMIVDISSYILGIIVAQFTSYLLGCNLKEPNTTLWYIAIFFLSALVILFIVFTFNPPKIDYFRDSVTGKYGI
ncbi:MAG: DUF6512 family protein [Clostridiaceae bacterium]